VVLLLTDVEMGKNVTVEYGHKDSTVTTKTAAVVNGFKNIYI